MLNGVNSKMRNLISDFSGGIPKKDASKADQEWNRAYRMGVSAASLAVDKSKLAEEKMQFEQQKNELVMAVLSMQQDHQQQQVQAQYQGAADATQQHLNDYSQSIGSLLGGGGDQQGQPQMQGQGGQQQQPQMM